MPSISGPSRVSGYLIMQLAEFLFVRVENQFMNQTYQIMGFFEEK